MSSVHVSVRPAPAGAGLFSYPYAGRHLLGLEGMSRETILDILDRAEHYRERFRTDGRPTDELAGLTVCNAFFEDSTRTRVSFEIAEKRLGALAVGFSAAG